MSFVSQPFGINQSTPGPSFIYEEKLAEGKHLFFVGHFSAETKDAEAISESLFGDMLEVMQSETIADPYDHFEAAVKTINERAEAFPDLKNNKPNLVIGFFDFVDLYLAQTGQAQTYLMRGTELSVIAEEAQGQDLFNNILSGQVSLNDVLIFASQAVLPPLREENLIEPFIQYDFLTAVNHIQADLEGAKPEKAAFLVIGVGKRPEEAQKPSPLASLKESAVGLIKNMTSAATETPKNVISEENTEKNALAGLSHEKSDASKRFVMPNISKRSLMMAAGVLGVLLISLGLRACINRESAVEIELKQKIELAQQSLLEADQLLAQGNRPEAALRLETAHESVDFVLKSGEKEYRVTAQDVLQQIEERKLVSENAEKTPASPLADLGLSLDQVSAERVVMDGNTNYILDNRNVHRVIRSNVEPGPSISEDATEILVAGALKPSSKTIVLLTDTPRIIEYTERTLTPMRTDDDVWKKGIDIATYGRFVYILDPVNNQIWKYERRRSTYGSASAYNLDSKADLSQAVSMTIDGSIYTFSADGTFQKLFRGEKVPFPLEEMPSLPLQGPNVRIYTRTGSDSLSILDPDHQRLLLFKKLDNKAIYQKQILYDVPDVTDFAVNDDESRATLITKERVYEVSL